MAILSNLQTRLMFPGVGLAAPTIDDATLRRAGIERWWLAGVHGRYEAWLLTAEQPRGAIIFAHGNGERIDDWPQALRFIPDELAFDLLLVEYPGYGRSTGVPTRTAIREMLCASFDRLVAERAPRLTVGFGRSIGGGAIGLLAAERNLDGLILASTFTSIRDLARDLPLVPSRLIENTFDTLSVVRSFQRPVLVIHGRNDELIPFRHGERLASAARDAKLLVDDGTHNDTPRDWQRFRDELGAWLDDVSQQKGRS